MFDYYKVSFRLKSEMLGTACQASPYDAHVLKKAQKMIKEANRLNKKLTKSLDKYAGYPISEDKQYEELCGIIRRYHEYLGRVEPIPDVPEELADYILKLEEELTEHLEPKQRQATIFFRDKDGFPMISTHMVLGNLKENLKIITNNTTLPKTEKIMPSKVSIGETMALDVKPVEEFMKPSKDIQRDEKGEPDYLERVIRFERMGKTETAIALSERLPVDTEFSCTLRVRQDSIFNKDDAKNLRSVFDLGRSNGLGQWRGSGSKGQYFYKVEKLKKNPEKAPKGWS